MSKPLNIQIIEKARFLIEKEEHWCRGTLAAYEEAKRLLNGCSVRQASSSGMARGR